MSENEDDEKASAIMDSYGGTRSSAENIYLPHRDKTRKRHQHTLKEGEDDERRTQWVGRADLM